MIFWHKYKTTIVLSLIALIVFAIITFNLICQTGISNQIDFGEHYQNYGSIISAIFTFISVILIVFTLNNQNLVSQKSNIENKLFQFINYHRENVSNMNYVQPHKEDKEVISGNLIFRKIYTEIHEIHMQLTGEECKNEQLSIIDSQFQKIPISKIDIINISYLIAFFGFEEESEEILKTKIGIEKYNYFIDVINSLKNKTAKYNNSIKFHGGHQRRLGHYFRNLYQAVKYIDEQQILTYEEKYNYVKLLRAQLSTYEQYVFFFNSISVLGEIWEIGRKDSNRNKCLNSHLVTKYNFITNIPAEIANKINLREFYPLLVFEGDIKETVNGHLIVNKKQELKSTKRVNLEKMYN